MTKKISNIKFFLDSLKLAVSLNYYHTSEKERGKHTYVEAKLNKALSEKLKDLDDKIENAEHSRSFFGDDMYKKLIEIDVSRGEALVHDRGMIYFRDVAGEVYNSNLFSIKILLNFYIHLHFI